MSTRDPYKHTQGDAEGFWACDMYSTDDGAQELTDTDPDEAIEMKLDWCSGPEGEGVLTTLRANFGETITVYGWTRRKLAANWPDWEIILEQVLEDLDEEYRAGADDPTDPTDAMSAAAEALAAVIRKEYVVWECEQTHAAEVAIEAWVRAVRPDWLESKTSNQT